MREQFYNCFNHRPTNNDDSQNAKSAFESSKMGCIEITSPFTFEVFDKCCADTLQIKTTKLTLKTEVPIRKIALKPSNHGIPKKTLIGKPIHCSHQSYCAYKGSENCLLTIDAFGCDNQLLPNATFAKMTPDALKEIIKTEGYKIVKEKGFLRALMNCGLSEPIICRVITPFLPEGKALKQFLLSPKKKVPYPVNEHALEQFIKTNGYEVVKTRGICAAARASKLSRVTVRRIMAEHPPQEPYIRTNWARRKTGEHSNKRRLSSHIRPKTLERFIKGNGYEIAKTQGMGAAASACGLNICSVAKILHHFSTMVNEQPIKKVT